MTAYDVLAELAEASGALRDAERRDYLWRSVAPLGVALRAQLAPLGERIYLERATVYVGDASYRQGATAIVLDFRFDVDDPFRIRTTCLVDHASIAVAVAAAPTSMRYERARALVESTSAAAGELSLRRLVELAN